MSFRTYCFRCEKYVTAHTTLLDAAELLRALKNDDDVEVMHISDNDGDHSWKLNRQEKTHLLNHITSASA